MILSLTPVQVCKLSSVVAIAAASYHNLALKSDGTVWAWGLNISSGNSAMEATTDHLTYFYTPSQVRGLDSVIAVAAGYRLSLALKSDGTVWAWGENEFMAKTARQLDLYDGRHPTVNPRSSAGSQFGGRHRCGR